MLIACGLPPVQHEASSPNGGKDAAGCYKYGYEHTSRQIVVYDDFWDNATDTERAAALQHEEGHCIYDFSHDVKDYLDDGCEASIMSVALPSNYCLTTHAEYYQADMAAKYAVKLVQDPISAVRSDDVIDESVASMF